MFSSVFIGQKEIHVSLNFHLLARYSKSHGLTLCRHCTLFVVFIEQLYPATPQAVFVDNEPGSALVLTIKSTQISACSSGSLVSKGRFQGKSV